jgi:hypothetical protein
MVHNPDVPTAPEVVTGDIAPEIVPDDPDPNPVPPVTLSETPPVAPRTQTTSEQRPTRVYPSRTHHKPDSMVLDQWTLTTYTL